MFSRPPSLLARRWISTLVLMALLFTQFASAAYACPRVASPEQQSAAMSDCHDMAMQAGSHNEPSALCKAHCVKDGQSTAATAAPDLQPNPAALTLLLGVIEPVATLAPEALGATAWQERPSGAPPLYLSLLVLRN